MLWVKRMRVILIGGPDRIGGASTEAMHTIKLWRRYGVDVVVNTTWGPIDADLQKELDDTGAETSLCSKGDIDKIPRIEGSVVVSFCNSNLFPIVPVLRKLDCRIVWSPCMCWIGDPEKKCLKDNGLFDAWHFQSEFQRGMLEPQLKELGYDIDMGHLIRGAFDTDGWDFNPTQHKRQTPFVFGKLARSDADKWSADYFRVYKTILYREKKLLMMGYSELAHRKLGTIPKSAEWLKPCAMPAKEFYGKVHCLWLMNGGAAENWPRVGLEAMALGVPVVAERRWGWEEMIDHGATGFLGDDDEAMAFYASLMAHDEVLRMKVVRQARERLEAVLARPDAVWAGWKNIFTKLGA